MLPGSDDSDQDEQRAAGFSLQQDKTEYTRLRHRVTLTLQNWRDGRPMSSIDAVTAEETLDEIKAILERMREQVKIEFDGLSGCCQVWDDRLQSWCDDLVTLQEDVNTFKHDVSRRSRTPIKESVLGAHLLGARQEDVILNLSSPKGTVNLSPKGTVNRDPRPAGRFQRRQCITAFIILAAFSFMSFWLSSKSPPGNRGDALLPQNVPFESMTHTAKPKAPEPTAAEPDAETPEPVAEPGAVAQPEAAAKPEVAVKPKPAPEPGAAAEPEAAVKSEAAVKPKAAAEPEAAALEAVLPQISPPSSENDALDDIV